MRLLGNRNPWTVLAVILLTALGALSALLLLRPEEGVRGKAPAAPLSDELSPIQQLAQDLALSDPEVQSLTLGHPSEVFGVQAVGGHFTPESQACAEHECWQVEIYNFDENATVTAIVDVEDEVVLDVLYLPGAHPGINKRLADLAIEIALNHPDVIEALGFQPAAADVDMAPVDAGLKGTACSEGHLCVAPTFNLGDRVLWAVVDLTEARLAGTAWTVVWPDVPENAVAFTPEGCPAPGALSRDGWSLSHEVTVSDGLRVYGVSYNGEPVVTSIKLVEWHVDYGPPGSGFEDTTGCGPGGGGFPISPFGETQVFDLLDGAGDVVGFEVVQDFRMNLWGNACNYRYDQHIQFFKDGRFRVVSGAYGKGCGTNALYRPVFRIDIAVNGDSGDSYARWDGSGWEAVSGEQYFTPYADGVHGPHEFTPEGINAQVQDQDGKRYYIEIGQGHFGDGGRGDDPFLYVTQHNAAEGDADLPVIGDCCLDDERQGPDAYVDGENVAQENLVLWYVPQMLTDGNPPDYYCWTVSGEPDPETYPCFSGPMFHLPVAARFIQTGPPGVGYTLQFTDTTAGLGPLYYQWDFGDGTAGSNDPNPAHQYASPGPYIVSLTVTNTLDTSTYTMPLTIGVAPTAGFTHNAPISVTETAVFTNTSTGTSPLSYLWNFGDGVTSTLSSPAHSYPGNGLYLVSLKATNFVTSDVYHEPIIVGVLPSGQAIYLPLIRK